MTIGEMLLESEMKLNQSYIGNANNLPKEFKDEIKAAKEKYGARNNIFYGKRGTDVVFIYNSADGKYIIQKIDTKEKGMICKKVDKINIKEYEAKYEKISIREKKEQAKIANNPDIGVKYDLTLATDLRQNPDKRLFYQDGFDSVPITGYYEPGDKDKMFVFYSDPNDKHIARASEFYSLVFKFNGYSLYFRKDGKTKRIRRYEVREEGIVFYAQR